jgi:hypothetical protein
MQARPLLLSRVRVAVRRETGGVCPVCPERNACGTKHRHIDSTLPPPPRPRRRSWYGDLPQAKRASFVNMADKSTVPPEGRQLMEKKSRRSLVPLNTRRGKQYGAI